MLRRLMLECAPISSSTKDMDFYIKLDYWSAIILKRRSLFDIRGCHSGVAKDSDLSAHDTGCICNRNSAFRDNVVTSSSFQTSGPNYPTT
jgi:hypothetical protein